MRTRHLNDFQALTAAEFDVDFNFGCAIRLLTVYIHSSVPITEDVTISYGSKVSALYDTIVEARCMQAEDNHVYAAVGTIVIDEGETLKVNVSNANTTGTVYVTAKGEAL